ncbi:GyrI-like domain-containing protein [Alkalihalobacillus sp. TS-13]|uniref:GyrI-like domain-containing protein n=1 Tax=Alkalihalobacillus sp. TS-13 TaxID=2842455 RepID=UPI001C88B60D|nr:effector binding domain-containing protein [Alkalihalobacillus sp. TS-13]
MQQKTKAIFDCEVMEKEFKMVGQSITANFPDAFPKVAMDIHDEFEKRTNEIKNAVDPNVIYAPYMCNEIVATYFGCLEVHDLESIPEGMLGLHIPATKYAKITCTNRTIEEGYTKLFEWMRNNGFKQKWFDRSFPMEIFYAEEGGDEEQVELLVPILDQAK